MSTELRINEFSKFHHFLTSESPEGYVPWFFPCEKNGKNPSPKAILKIDSTSKGSWHHPSARLSKEQAIDLIKQGYNIGISARNKDPLIVGDIDDPEYLKQIPKDTLTSTSRKRVGAHFFGWDKDGSAKINLPCDFGEIRSNNQYVLAPGSYVPFNLQNEKDKKAFDKLPKKVREDTLIGYYTIRDSNHPREMTFSDLPLFFRKKEMENIESAATIKTREEIPSNSKEGKYSELFKLKVSDIVGLIPANKRRGHPLHDSDTDANFSLSKDGSLAHCWRHLVSLNAVQYLCVKTGYAKCEDAGTPHKGRGLSKIQGDKKACEIAYREAIKLGLIGEYKSATIKNVPFIWEEEKLIKNKSFPMDNFDGTFFYGLLLPKEIDNVLKGEVVGKKQILSPALITNEGGIIEWNLRARENLNLDFSTLPTSLPPRWKLEHIKSFLDNKSEKVDGKELLKKISNQYEKYLAIRNKTWYSIHSLWDVGTYLYQLFGAYPFIELRGIAGTGKTKSMTISSFISFNGGKIMVNPSESTLFRYTDEVRGAKYFDEAEKLWVYNKSTKQYEGDVRTELINASYSKDASVPRQEKILNKFVTKWYSPYSPTQLSSVNGLYGATETRAITRITTKSGNDDERGESEPLEDKNQPIWEEIRDKCYRFALENWEEIKEIYDNFPKDIDLKRRDLQIWKPLLAISKFIDEDVMNEVVKFAKEITQRRTEDLIQESSFDYNCLDALKHSIESSDSNKIYVEGIKRNYCALKGNEEGLKDPYLNRNISHHLDKLGFKELRKKDRNGSYFSATRDVFNEIVVPICPELAFLSSPSPPSSQLEDITHKKNKKGDDSMTIGDDKKRQDVTMVTINDDDDDGRKEEGINFEDSEI